MKPIELLLASLLVGILLVVSLLFLRPLPQSQRQPEVVEVVREPEVQPYWTVYGSPTYWPFYLSPYWYYGVPWGGPIQGGGYDRRGLYAPHGPRPGYTGVSVGGGGGGGHGGGHGGH
jgi:hypothetical protein